MWDLTQELAKIRAFCLLPMWVPEVERGYWQRGRVAVPVRVALGQWRLPCFLQMACGSRLRETFEEELLRKLVVEHATRRDVAKIAVALGFVEEKKMIDIIEELVENGQEIEAVYFTLESGFDGANPSSYSPEVLSQ